MGWRHALEDLYRRDGKLHPEQIVAEAVDPSSPLHDEFEWDDRIAGHQWRLQQARVLARRWEVLIGPDQVRTRRFEVVERGEGYRPIEEIVGDADLAERFVQRLRRDVEHAIGKYERFRLIYGRVDELVTAIEDSLK